MDMLAISVILAWLVAVAGCWVGYQLVRQNGRVLLRLEALERQLAELRQLAQGAAVRAPAAAQAPPPSMPQGLPRGAEAPAFELSALSGERVSLDRYRGKRVLLVFFNPQCGFCVRMAPELAALPVDGVGGQPIPLVVSAGDLQANRRLVKEHGIRAPVLMQRGQEIAALYRAHGTPTGYLIDEQGRIGSDLAIGAQALLALAQPGGGSASASPTHPGSAARNGHPNGNGHKAPGVALKGSRPLAASKINRNGLSAGTPAPDFRLPRVDAPDGGELALADYRGRSVLLVFSDPHCGPCMALAPRLEELHRRAPELEVLMVSRGSVEENRQKVAEYGLSYPVVLQKQWEVSRDYAMFATPVGYVIDENGIIAADVAVGADAILALASPAPSSAV